VKGDIMPRSVIDVGKIYVVYKDYGPEGHDMNNAVAFISERDAQRYLKMNDVLIKYGDYVEIPLKVTLDEMEGDEGHVDGY
jgi:hypothetical protein